MSKNLSILVILVAVIVVVGAYKKGVFSGDIFNLKEDSTNLEQNLNKNQIEKTRTEEKESAQQKSFVSDFGKVCGYTMTTSGAAGFGDQPAPYSTKVIATSGVKKIGEDVSEKDGYYEIELAYGSYILIEEKYGTTKNIEINKPGCLDADFIVGFPSQYDVNPE